VTKRSETVRKEMVVRSGKRTRRKKTRGEMRIEATRQALLAGARELFAQKGFDLTTIDDITERADVGKGTFYYHFKNKHRLVSELMKSMLAELRSVIDGKCQGITDLDQLLDHLIEGHIDFFSKRWEDFVLYFQGRADLTLQEGYEGIETPFNEYLEHIADLLDGVIKYHLDRIALTRVSCAVAGFVSGYYSFAVIASEENELDETLRPVRKSLVAGLSRFIKEAIPNEGTPVRW